MSRATESADASLTTVALGGRAPARHRWALGLALLAVVALVVTQASDYRLFQLTMVLSYAMAILGLDIVVGFNGQLSLGHGAFYAIGAYTTGILMAKAGLPYWATLPASALIAFAVGFLFGMPALRLGSLYLALTTFALASVVPQLLRYKAVAPWTGGVGGLVLDKPDAPFDLPLSQDQWLFLFTLATTVLVFWVLRNLLRGRIGRAMMAIRDHPLAAEAMGIDLAMVKTSTFAWSAMVTGLAGSLGAIAVQFVAPDSFTSFLSISFFVGLVVGGTASIWGAFLGAAFVEFLPNLVDSVSKAAPGAIYGALLILVIYAAPGGLAGLIRDGWASLRRGLGRAAARPDG
jgi:branched-chain amino acid transport system permease protein